MQRSNFLLAALTFCAVTANAADVSGKWSGYPGYFVLKQEGMTLTGTIGQSANEQYPFEEGKVDGNRLSFKVGSYQADLRLEGEEIHGTLASSDRPMKVFLKRVDETAVAHPFDVASVKRSAKTGSGNGSSMSLNPGRLTCTSASLKKLIATAYDLKDYQISTPDWMNSEVYDVVATFPAGTQIDLVRPMLKQLLAERMKLKVHRETKELPVYALVLDKAGLQLKPGEPMGGTRSSGGPKGRTLTGDMSMDRLAAALGNTVDRPVINFTGVKGVFQVKLEWTPDDTHAPESKGDGPLVNDAVDGQSIYAALHKIGLKLEPRKAPVEILVVDGAEKIPVEN